MLKVEMKSERGELKEQRMMVQLNDDSVGAQ